MVAGEGREEDAAEEEEEPGELRDTERTAEVCDAEGRDSAVPALGLSPEGPERFKVGTDSSDMDASWSYRGSARGNRRMSPSISDAQLADMRREQMELHRRFAEKEQENRKLQAENHALKAEIRRAKAMEAMVGRLHEHRVSQSKDPLADPQPEESEVEKQLRRRLEEAEERSRVGAEEENSELQEKVKRLEQELLAVKRAPEVVHVHGPQMPEPARRLSTGSQQRRLLQMDSIAARLHEELRRRGSGATAPEEVRDATPQTVSAYEGGDKSPSQSSYYAASVQSDAAIQRTKLDRQIKAFSRRFVTLRDMR